MPALAGRLAESDLKFRMLNPQGVAVVFGGDDAGAVGASTFQHGGCFVGMAVASRAVSALAAMWRCPWDENAAARRLRRAVLCRSRWRRPVHRRSRVKHFSTGGFSRWNVGPGRRGENPLISGSASIPA
jgi:hypothetical protein